MFKNPKQTGIVTANWLCVKPGLVFVNVVQMLKVGSNYTHISGRALTLEYHPLTW